MLLQSEENFYIYDKKSKYLFPVHPVVLAHIRADYLEKTEILQETKEKFTTDESDLLYKQYLFFKEQFLCPQNKQSTCYGYIDSKTLKNSFDSTSQIVFEVTESCNLQCVYCSYGDYYNGYDKRNQKNLDFVNAKTLLDYYIPIWKRKVQDGLKRSITISFYGGEPLVNYKLISRIINYCESLGFEEDFFKYSMTTNGLLIKKYQDFLIDKNFQLLVSLDGNRNNNDFRIRKTGKKSFDDIITNLITIKENNPSYFEKKVSFISVMHKKNSFMETLNFIKKKFNKLPSMTSLSKENIQTEKRIIFDLLIDKESAKEINEDVLGNLTDEELGKYDVYSFLRKNTRHYFNHYHEIYQVTKNKVITPTGTCIPFTRKVFLTAHSKIMSCERIHNQHTIGYIGKTEGLILDYETAANNFNHIVSNFKEHCIECFNSNACEICAFKYLGSSCDKYMNESDFLNNLSFNIKMVEKYPHTYRYFKHITNN